MESRSSKELIMLAAYNLFAEKGFKGTSIDDVAMAAGYSRQAVYFYFHGKEDLLLTTIEYHRDILWCEFLSNISVDTLPIENRLLNSIIRTGEIISAFKNYREISVTVAALRPELTEQVTTKYIEAVSELLENTEIAERWRSVNISPRDLAEQIVNVCTGVIFSAEWSKEAIRQIEVILQLTCRSSPLMEYNRR